MTLVLVGNDKGGTIAAFRLSDDGAHLERLADTHVGTGCSTFAVDGDRIYTAVKEPAPAIVTLSLNRDTGELTEESRREVSSVLGYLGYTDGVLLGASYHGGWGEAWPVVDGVVGEPTAHLEARNMHASVPVGDNAYFVSLGDDLIAQFSLAEGAQLVELSEPTVAWTAGTGPRHLTASADGRNAYVITEFSGEAVRFHRDLDSGRLTPAESVIVVDPDANLKHSTYGADPRAGHLIWCADVWLARGDRFLLATERTASTVATVAVAEDGTLGDVVAITPTEEQPRGMAVSPDGALAVVVGERSGHATLYSVGDDGALTALDRVETGTGPNWVRFV
ncbi:MAG TPA: lactonase family protein [Tessaracoccus flavescens]|uniref:Lactonase family protein n=1 Tax=Tessaracoccus flavescens TaxID=399497 RepID=A0A921EP66_9ACTN|nr:lactonase family protein [Tessaracoccus flavescens]